MIKKFILLKLLFIPLFVSAGTSYFGLSPKSLGSLQSQNSTAALGRGGFELAHYDTLSLNNSNYALWSYITKTTINLKLGYNTLSTETESQSFTSTTGNFDGGHLAMPIISKKLALGVGLLPAIRNDQSLSLNDVGFDVNATEKLKTSGNISEVSFILSYAFNKHFSVAAVASYNFGMITDKLSIEYNRTGYEDIKIFTNYKIYGNLFAIHSFYKISDKIFSGLRVKFPAKLTMRTEQESRHINQFVNEYRKITIPLKTALGISYKFDNLIIMGIDLDYQSWESGYKIDDISPTGFNDSYQISAGLEKMPEGRRFVSYYQKMYYRGGIYFGQLNVESNNNNVYEYGIGIGLGLPILTPYNRIDLAIQYGKRGSLSTNSAVENIFKINISVIASNLWFIQTDN